MGEAIFKLILIYGFLAGIIICVEYFDQTATIKDHVVIALLYIVILGNEAYSDDLSEIKAYASKIFNALNERDF